MSKVLRIPERFAGLPLVLAVTGFLGAFLVWPLAHVFVNAVRDPGGLTAVYLRHLLICSSPNLDINLSTV